MPPAVSFVLSPARVKSLRPPSTRTKPLPSAVMAGAAASMSAAATIVFLINLDPLLSFVRAPVLVRRIIFAAGVRSVNEARRPAAGSAGVLAPVHEHAGDADADRHQHH